MKHLRHYLVAFATLLIAQTGFAQLENGTVYWIQDVATGQFISQGANWGTQATVKDVGGVGLEAVYMSDGVYQLKNIMWNKVNNANLGLRTSDRFLDQAAGNCTLIASGEGYLINTDAGYICNNQTANAYGVKALGVTANAEDATVWRFLTKAQYDAALAELKDKRAAEFGTTMGYDNITSVATLESTITNTNLFLSKDVTTSITNPTLGSKWDGWTHGAATGSNRAEGSGIGQGCAEFWNGCGYATQTISGLANGLYKVDFAGTFRPKDANNANKLTSEQTSSPAFVSANNDKVELLHWIDVAAKANSRSGIVKPDYNNTIYTYVTDGTLTLTVVQDAWYDGFMWCPFGQFALTYYTDQVSEADIQALVATIPTAIPTAVATNLASLKNALESSSTISNFNALSNAIASANTLVSTYNKYNEVKTAADALVSNTDVYTGDATIDYTNADSQLGAATTIAEIEAAISTLRAATATFLGEVKVNDGSYFDITDVFLNNADISEGTQLQMPPGWETNYVSGQQANNIGCQFNTDYTNGDVTISKFIEAWRWSPAIGDGYLRQTVSNLPEGKYTLEADAIAADQPGGTQPTGAYLYITADGVNYETTMATADGQPEHFTTEFLNTGASDVVFGMKTVSTTANWIAADNFTVKFYGIDLSAYVTQLQNAVTAFEALEANADAADYATYKAVVDANNQEYNSSADYAAAIAAVQQATTDLAAITNAKSAYTAAAQAATQAKNDNPNVTGEELTALNNAIAEEPEDNTVEAYNILTNALTQATSTLVTAAPSYNEYVAEVGRAALVGVTPETTPTSAADAVTAAHALQVAEYAQVIDDYEYDMTGIIGDFGTWTGTATVAGEPAVPNYLTNEHWSGTTHAYYEQASTGWGNANGWTIKYEKTAKLPAGDYLLKVAARASGDTHGTITCTATDAVVALPNVNASSRGIALNGEAKWEGENSEFARDGVGYGWQWRYLPFSLTEETTVTMTFYAETSVQYNWMSIADGQLLAKQEFEKTINISDNDTQAPENGIVSEIITDRKLYAGPNTIVLPFDATAAEIGATKVLEYKGTEVVDDVTRVLFKQVEEVNEKVNLVANTPYVVFVDEDQTEALTFSGIRSVAPADAVVTDAAGVFNFVGQYAALASGNETIVAGDYILGSTGNFRRANGGNALKAYRAFLKNVGGGVENVKFDIDGVETTGIEAVELHDALFGGNAVYNLNGQRVNSTQRGIYIVNGKKVVLK